MSFESTEERIERLEEQVAVLLQFRTVSLEQHRNLPKVIVELKYFHVALLRFLASLPLIEDDKVRQQFLDGISRLESVCEKTEAMAARLGKEVQNPETPPSSDLSSPGQA